MPSNLSRPVADLEGIGPAIAQVLGAAGLRTIGDLLRVPAESIHAAVTSRASLKQARSWRSMAMLLEIPAMTPQWAEALVWKNVVRHADLCQATFEELAEYFAAALAAGRIPAVPDAPTLAAIMSGSVALLYTGAVTGELRSGSGAPVADAEVRIGHGMTTSDAQGRFRIAGLPRRLELLVVATHPTAGSARAVVEAERTDVARLTRLTVEVGGQPYRRSQLDGERLPRDLDYPVTTEEVPFGSVANNDLFKVILFYADGVHAKLTSKLLTFEDGRLQVHWTKAPISALPVGVALHDHLLKRASGWRTVPLSPQLLRAYKRLLRVKAQFRHRPLPSALADRKLYYADALAALKVEKVFQRGVR